MTTENQIDFIDRNAVERLVTEYCKVSGVVAVCLKPDGSLVYGTGSLAGITDDADWCSQLVESELVKGLASEVDEDSIEDISYLNVLPEDMEEGLWIAALSVRFKGQVASKWIIAASGLLSEKEFIERIDLLRDFCNTTYASKASIMDAQLDGAKSRQADLQMSQTKNALDATTSILQLLDNSSRSEQVMQNWLEIVQKYLGIEFAQIFRINDDGQTMDILAESRNPGLIPLFEEKKSIKKYDFINTDAPVVLSSDAIMLPENYSISELGIKAVMLLPLLKRSDGAGSLLASFEYHISSHTWMAEEVKFASDSARVIQSVLLSRINKNSVAGSFRALEDILNNIGASVYLTSRKTGKVIFCNHMLLDTFKEEWSEGKLQSMVANGIDQNAIEGDFEIYNSRQNHWYEVTFKQLEWVDGSDAILYSLYDITDRKLHQRKIEQQAFTDFLTGLYNRMCCERDLARLIDEARKEDTHGALVYLDLDDFKHINDGLGHQYGDVLLKSISNALRGVSGIENNCYRMGGDEFVILISPSSYEKFESILVDIKDVFSRPFFLKDADYYCTSSIGVVTFPENGDSVQSLIRKADIAMYEAKKSGKNRLARYSSDQDSASGRRLDMEKNMRDAEVTDYDEFLVFYQPIIDVEDGLEECIGAEALVRWDSEQLGFVSPVDFIPLAEYLGLINPIGDHVLKKACETVKKWNDRGYDYMKVNVNLSVVQLLQNNIVELVEQALKDTGLNPKNLCLEVTESLAINDMQRMIGILTRIKALGVSIALDDFGTGYSSLNHIREIPFDIIKVDQSFVKDLAGDAYSQAFVKMVAELAETIGVKICVEGIENPDQYNVVKGFKVKYIQGYYFDKPLPQKAFEEKYLK